MLQIQPARLMTDLRELAQIGHYKTGVHRPTYSAQDMAARQWVCDRMTEAGLQPAIDGIGNIFGRNPHSGPRLIVGSHVETQPYAGWLDGAMGVIYGLELVRAFAESPACADFAVDVAAWADEEGYFGAFLGSRSFFGEVTEEMLDAARDGGGKPLRAALAEAGLASRPRLQIDPREDYVGYLEAHVEQGDYLEQSELQIGIVTGSVGIHLFKIKATGQQNHAGTTRMAVRKDAGVAMMRLWHAIDQKFAAVAGPRSVWTVGRITMTPGSPSVIPGDAEMLLQFRDPDPAQLTLFDGALTDLVAKADADGPCSVTLEIVAKTRPDTMDARFQDALERAADEMAPGRHMRMPSAAGHDAQVIARHIPAAMLFVPSIGGISHHYTEDTKEEDIVAGCQVFVKAVEYIMRDSS